MIYIQQKQQMQKTFLKKIHMKAWTTEFVVNLLRKKATKLYKQKNSWTLCQNMKYLISLTFWVYIVLLMKFFCNIKHWMAKVFFKSDIHRCSISNLSKTFFSKWQTVFSAMNNIVLTYIDTDSFWRVTELRQETNSDKRKYKKTISMISPNYTETMS